MKRLALVLVLMGACEKKTAPPAPDAETPLTEADRHALADKVLARECQICHSLDLIRSQRLTRGQWEKELVKMTGWGAVIADAEAPIVLDDLAASASLDAGPYAYASLASAELERSTEQDRELAAGDVGRGEQKYKAMCLACHAADGKGMAALGPTLLGRPVLRRRADFAKVIRDGRNKMPAFAAAVDAQGIDDIAAYLRAR
jgi:cytochrome c oxidase cbb3-type subunit 3